MFTVAVGKEAEIHLTNDPLTYRATNAAKELNHEVQLVSRHRIASLVWLTPGALEIVTTLPRLLFQPHFEPFHNFALDFGLPAVALLGVALSIYNLAQVTNHANRAKSLVPEINELHALITERALKVENVVRQTSHGNKPVN